MACDIVTVLENKEIVMNEDLIRRSDAIKAMEQRYQDILRIFKRKVKDGEKAIALDMIGCIKALPSADKSGDWITVWDECGENENGYECSECGAEVDEKFPNCPYCRARMKGADDE